FLSYPIAFFKAHVLGFNRSLLGFLLLFLLLWRLLSRCSYLLCQAAVSASLLAAEGVTMEATVTLECSSAHEMMVMENVPVNLGETVLPLGSFAEMTA